MTRKANRIERNVVTCYIFGKPDAIKERVVNTFVGHKTPAPMALNDEEADKVLLRAIGAVVEKDVPRYLFVRSTLVVNVVWAEELMGFGLFVDH